MASLHGALHIAQMASLHGALHIAHMAPCARIENRHSSTIINHQISLCPLCALCEKKIICVPCARIAHMPQNAHHVAVTGVEN
jgi:hypothetical protein